MVFPRFRQPLKGRRAIPARQSRAAPCYTTASSAAAPGHLGAAHKRGAGAKTARSREGWGHAAGLAKIADTLSEPRAIRATEPGLRALDLRLCMLRARLRRAEAQRVPLPVLQLSDRIQSKPGL